MCSHLAKCQWFQPSSLPQVRMFWDIWDDHSFLKGKWTKSVHSWKRDRLWCYNSLIPHHLEGPNWWPPVTLVNYKDTVDTKNMEISTLEAAPQNSMTDGVTFWFDSFNDSILLISTLNRKAAMNIWWRVQFQMPRTSRT